MNTGINTDELTKVRGKDTGIYTQARLITRTKHSNWSGRSWAKGGKHRNWLTIRVWKGKTNKTSVSENTQKVKTESKARHDTRGVNFQNKQERD